MVYGARALVLLWAGFWIFFFVGSVIVEGAPGRVIAVGSAVLLLFVILALVPWRWEAPGGRLLVVMSLLIGVAYAIASASFFRRNDGSRLPLAVRAITTVVFTGPPLMAGVLFLLHHRIASTPAGAR